MHCEITCDFPSAHIDAKLSISVLLTNTFLLRSSRELTSETLFFVWFKVRKPKPPAFLRCPLFNCGVLKHNLGMIFKALHFSQVL